MKEKEIDKNTKENIEKDKIQQQIEKLKIRSNVQAWRSHDDFRFKKFDDNSEESKTL